jgi:hypothetical protein
MIIEGTTESWLTVVGMAEDRAAAIALLTMGAGAASVAATASAGAPRDSAGAFDSDLPQARISAAMVATTSKRRDV